MCDGPWIGSHDLLIEDSDHHDEIISTTTLKQSIEDAEVKAINTALAENDGKINQASDALGISRKNLWEKMKRYGIRRW